MTLAFDEMTGTDGSVRPPYEQLKAWLAGIAPDILDHRRREAELIFRRIGITFAVYGDAELDRAADPVRRAPPYHFGA